MSLSLLYLIGFTIWEVASFILRRPRFTKWQQKRDEEVATEMAGLINRSKQSIRIVTDGLPSIWGDSQIEFALQEAAKRMGSGNIRVIVAPEIAQENPLREYAKSQLITLDLSKSRPKRYFAVSDWQNLIVNPKTNWFKSGRNVRFAGETLLGEFTQLELFSQTVR